MSVECSTDAFTITGLTTQAVTGDVTGESLISRLFSSGVQPFRWQADYARAK